MSKESEFDLRLFLPYLLNQAAEESSLEFQKIYKNKYGLLRTDWRVLFHLGIYGRMTARDIGAKAKIHKTKVSRAVHRLAQHRFMIRERDEKDRRVEWLILTQSGLAAYEDLRASASRYESDLVKGLSGDEKDALQSILQKIAKLDG